MNIIIIVIIVFIVVMILILVFDLIDVDISEWKVFFGQSPFDHLLETYNSVRDILSNVRREFSANLVIKYYINYCLS